MRLTITAEPWGDTYGQLIRLAEQWCGSALLVVRPDLGLSTEAGHLLHELQSLGATTRRSTSWPGTVLLRGEATVYECALTDRTTDFLATRVHRLFGWQQPERPEDLCLLRPSGDAWLVTVAHEADAYIDVRDDELATLQEALPDFTASLVRDPEETAPH